MKNTKLTKIFVLVLSLALLIGSAIGIATSAETAEPTYEIKSMNISHGDTTIVLVAVDAPVTGSAPSNVTVKYVDANGEEQTAKYYGDMDVYGTTYPVWYTKGIPAKDLGQDVVATVYVDDVAGDTTNVSVAEYLYGKLYKEGYINATDTKDINKKNLYLNLLDYAASAETVLWNDKDENASNQRVLITDKFYVYAEGATIDADKTVSSGVFATAQTVTLTATGTAPTAWEVTTYDENNVATTTLLYSNSLTVDKHTVIKPASGGKYYLDNSIEGTRYDFSDAADYGTDKMYAKESGTTSETVLASVSDGALKFDSNGTKWKTFALATTEATGTKYIFETDFVWTGGSYLNDYDLLFMGFLGEHDSVYPNQQFNKYLHAKFDSENADNLLIGYGASWASLTRNVNYNLRFEYVVSTGVIGLYVNDVAVAMGNGTTDTSKYNPTDATYEAFGLYTRNISANATGDLEFTLDNVYMGVGTDTGIPEGLATYYNGGLTGVIEGAKYDFANAEDYGTAVLYNKTEANGVIATEIASVTDGVLSFSHNSYDLGNYLGMALSSGLKTDETYNTYAEGSTYIFETDFKWIGGYQDNAEQIPKYAAYISLFGDHAAIDNTRAAYSIVLKYIENDYSGIMLGNTRLEVGVTYNIRIEVTVGEGLKLFVNGIESTDTAVFVGTEGRFDETTYQAFGIYSRRNLKPALEFTMDNVYMGVIPAATE